MRRNFPLRMDFSWQSWADCPSSDLPRWGHPTALKKLSAYRGDEKSIVVEEYNYALNF